MKLQTPKGFRDFLPADALRRKFVVGKITSVFEKFGFDPLETPALEYEETLAGKYGEEEKLIYKFETPGGDKVALRYDQTVPLARVAAQYGPTGQQVLSIPFKRYQVQSNFRGENTQKGRYREFTQADADIVSSSSPLADAEILALLAEIYQALGLEVIIKVNDRTLFGDIEPKFLAAIDKLLKIGEDAVLEELVSKGMNSEEAKKTLESFKSFVPSDNLKETMELFEKLGYSQDLLEFDATLVRGLDYYTGLIIEVVLKSRPNSSSLCGGGRYDKLIGKFSGTDMAAVGFAIGLDRTIEAMEEEGVELPSATSTQVLVTIFSGEQEEKSLEVVSKLREGGISAEIWLDSGNRLDKQLKYADQKGIPFAVIVGPDEAEKNLVTLKNLEEKAQLTLSLDELVQKLSS